MSCFDRVYVFASTVVASINVLYPRCAGQPHSVECIDSLRLFVSCPIETFLFVVCERHTTAGICSHFCYTVLRRITTFRSMDRVYDGGPIIL
jgi:hypothetical protein